MIDRILTIIIYGAAWFVCIGGLIWYALLLNHIIRVRRKRGGL